MQEDANGTTARLNDREFAYVGGTGDQFMITVACAEDGRLMRRREGSRGRAVSRLTLSADLSTIYFVAGSQVWYISAAGGDAREFAGPAASLSISSAASCCCSARTSVGCSSYDVLPTGWCDAFYRCRLP
jgi:hypothetical protein